MDKETRLEQLVGEVFLLETRLPTTTEGSMQVPVKVVTCRKKFGKGWVMVTPVGGSGEIWVSADKISRRGGAAV